MGWVWWGRLCQGLATRVYSDLPVSLVTQQTLVYQTFIFSISTRIAFLLFGVPNHYLWNPTDLTLFLPNLFSPSLVVWCASSSEDFPAVCLFLILPPLFSTNISLNKPFAHLIPSWHLFFGELKVTHHQGLNNCHLFIFFFFNFYFILEHSYITMLC